MEENTPAKPHSGIAHIMKVRASPLLVVPQSILVEATTKFIQSKIDSENYGKDWLCPQDLVSTLVPTTNAITNIF